MILREGALRQECPYDKSLSFMQMQIVGLLFWRVTVFLGCLSHCDHLKNHLWTLPKEKNCGHPFAFLGNSNGNRNSKAIGMAIANACPWDSTIWVLVKGIFDYLFISFCFQVLSNMCIIYMGFSLLNLWICCSSCSILFLVCILFFVLVSNYFSRCWWNHYFCFCKHKLYRRY